MSHHGLVAGKQWEVIMVDRGLVSDLDEAASHVGGVIKLPDAVGDADLGHPSSVGQKLTVADKDIRR